MKPPNIVLFVADQFRGDALGCDGNIEVKTPCYDALAAAGVRFKNAFTPCPICVPARATMITGRYPHKVTGTKDNCGAIPDEQVKLPELLAKNGYSTYSSGKLHYLPYMPPGQPRILHGFQHAKLAESGRILANYDPSGEKTGLEDYFDYLGTVGWNGYTRAHGIGNNDIHPAASPLPGEHTVDAWVATEAIAYVDRHRHESPQKPFFLHVSFPKPHAPFDPPRPYDALYDPRLLARPVRQDDALPRSPQIQIYSRKHGWNFLSSEAQQVIKSHYYGLITFQDAQAGRVINHLKAVGEYDNTVFIFVSDHGEMLGDFGAYFKSLMYEGSVRVPFLVAGAGIAAKGTASDALVGLQDLMPTICTLAGVEPAQPMDGVPLNPALRGEAFDPRSEFVAYCNDAPQQTYMVRTRDSKFIYNELNGVEEFYDLLDDPREQQNRIADPGYAEQVNCLRLKMIDWARQNGDHQLLRNGRPAVSEFDPAGLTFSASVMGWRHY